MGVILIGAVMLLYRELRRRNKILEAKTGAMTRAEPEKANHPGTCEIGGTGVSELPHMRM